MNAWIRDYPDVDSKTHQVIINYTKVYCDDLHCDFEDYFETIEDAEIAATIHEEAYS